MGLRGTWLVFLLLALPGCNKGRPAATISLLLDFSSRVATLRPPVEAEIGRPLGRIEIVLCSRAEMAEAHVGRARQVLDNLENGPRGVEVEPQGLAAGDFEWAEACVDPAGRILVPDSAREEPGPFDILLDYLPKATVRDDPRAKDLLLIHELVHVHQGRHLEGPAFYGACRSRSDLLARRALAEGHAEYLTRRIAVRMGMEQLHDEWYRARTETARELRGEAIRTQVACSDAHESFAYVQGRKFVEHVVARLGHDAAILRIFADPPSLAAVSRPEEYFRPGEPCRWDARSEDLRRWLAREREHAELEPIALPMISVLAGEGAAHFREGFRLTANEAGVTIHLLVADDDSGARLLHSGWIAGLRAMSDELVEAGLPLDVSIESTPGCWVLQDLRSLMGADQRRRAVVVEGTLVVDVECTEDSAAEQGAERLARRALRFLTDDDWRAAWFSGSSPGLSEWEARWSAYELKMRDLILDDEERQRSVNEAIGDTHPCVQARGLRAARKRFLADVPWPLVRERMGSPEGAVRFEAWRFILNDFSEDPDGEVASLAEAAFKDAELGVRLQIARHLNRFQGDPRLVALCGAALADTHALVRGSALTDIFVSCLSLPELLPKLLGLLDEFPGSAAEALGQLGATAEIALPRLRELLKVPGARAQAAQAIFRISGDVGPLFDLLRSTSASGTPLGFSALGEAGDLARPVVAEIASALDHKSRWIRSSAATALGKIGGADAKAALVGSLAREQDSHVLKVIRKALLGVKAP